jgi:nucleotide-binding universal stress UspA family protein
MTMIDYSTIVVGLDGSQAGLPALRFARAELELRGEGASLVVLAALTDLLGLGRDDEADDYETQRAAALREHVADLIGDPSIDLEVRLGNPARVLAEASAPAELLVMGKRGHGSFSDLVLGSTTISCLQFAQCPVAVVSAETEGVHPNVVSVGIDGSTASHRALAWAAEEAARRGAVLDLISVWRRPRLWEAVRGSLNYYQARAERFLELALAGVDHSGLELSVHVIEGRKVQALIEATSEAGLLVLGNGAHEGGRFHGHSTAISVTTHARCPIVVCP